MKWVLCVVSSGLNDALCQIERCYKYAQGHDRHVIVAFPFPGVVSSFFSLIEMGPSQTSVFFGLPPNQLLDERIMSVYPEALRGRFLQSLQLFEPTPGGLLRDKLSQDSLTFDFAKDYPHDVLIHHQWGGGANGQKMFEHLRLRHDITHKVEIPDALKASPYTICHLRFSDIVTDYRYFLSRENKSKRVEPLMVCSDNEKIKDFSKQAIKTRSVVASKPEFDLKGQQIHAWTTRLSEDEGESEGIRILVELWSAANATDFRYTFCEPKSNGNCSAVWISGFSRLLMHMYRRHEIATAFFRRDVPYWRVQMKSRPVLIAPLRKKICYFWKFLTNF